MSNKKQTTAKKTPKKVEDGQHAQPIGIPVEMREDAKGLWVKARVSKTALGDEALVELMRDSVAPEALLVGLAGEVKPRRQKLAQ
mgnify:CR=1 FL=1